MSCVLRLQGSENLLSCVRQAGLTGSSPAKTGGRGYVNITISEAEFSDLPSQIFDALAFLRKHVALLRGLCDVATARGSIDFGIESCDMPAQTKSFPSELICLLGNLGLGLEISIYQVSSE